MPMVDKISSDALLGLKLRDGTDEVSVDIDTRTIVQVLETFPERRSRLMSQT